MGKKERVILFQGDSITDGGRLKGKENEWDLNHQMGHGYAYLINAALGTAYPQAYFRFYNRGISGNRIADLYGRWKEDTLNLNPDVLSILIGINDCGSTLNDQSGSSLDRFEKIYQLLLDEAFEKNESIRIVICEPFALPVGAVAENYAAWTELLKPLQEKARMVADRNHAVFVPLQSRFEEMLQFREPEYWIWDGIHPTVCGHQVIADQWMKYAGKYLMSQEETDGTIMV